MIPSFLSSIVFINNYWSTARANQCGELSQARAGFASLEKHDVRMKAKVEDLK
jgi:hypothetical protein